MLTSCYDLVSSPIKVHRQHVMEKMGAGSLAELVRMADRLESPRHSSRLYLAFLVTRPVHEKAPRLVNSEDRYERYSRDAERGDRFLNKSIPFLLVWPTSIR
jgi:hypothetical protein